MGRELQKKKRRSSLPKVRRKPKSKKRILSNHIIAENWDKSQTLAQNYRRLGLAARLNKSTGGVEKTAIDVHREHEENGDGSRSKLHGLVIGGGSRKAAQQMDVKEARVERDPETGRILRIVDSGTVKANPLQDPLNELESDSDVSETEMFDQHGRDPGIRKPSEPKTTVVRSLQQEASKPAVKYKFHQSEGERSFVQALVKKYGDDYGKMARDMKINYMQRSEGDLKRRIRRWRDAGGTLD